MKKFLKPKNAIPILSFIIVVSLLIGVAYSNWFPQDQENYYKKIRIFQNVLQRIQYAYVEETDPSKLIDDAIRGMVKNLDPHTNYMTVDEVENWNKTYQGYSGIGISFEIINQKITIMSVMEGPSKKIGLLAGDRIIRINGESAINIKRDDVPKKLMGPQGTTVDVSIERTGWDKLQDFTIKRDKIKVVSVPVALMLEAKLGYIKIDRFSATTSSELEDALNKLESKGMEQLVLDLRNNGGGYLQMAVEVSEKFIPEKKMIVYTKGRIPQAYREYHSSNSSKHRMLPLIVLINQSSASASEIVSGAVQDWDRGLVAGRTSFGKGLVQTQFGLQDGSQLLMTTARYYTPSGRLIQREYDDKSFEAYYREAYNDSIRNEKLAELPKFKTFAGRTVYGGGGITPDIWLEDNAPASSQFVIKLYYDPKRYIYSFSEEIQKENPNVENMTAMEFAQNFEITDENVKNFAVFVLDKGYKATEEDFVSGMDDLKFLLKREISYRLWGDDGQFYVNNLRDNVLQEVKALFPDAKKLLAMSTLQK